MEAQLMPMLCGRADVVPEGEKWLLEGKLDGWRVITHVTDAGVAVYGGRNGSEYGGKLPYIEQALAASLPANTVVDGELIGSGWGDVQGVMTRGNGPHVPSEAIPALTYVVFDILRVDGADARSLALEDRRALLETVDWQGDRILLSPAGESTQAAHDEMLALGLEGTVSKRKDSRYVNGRSNYWIKVKPKVATSDEAIVHGFKPGTGSLEGKVGAFEIEMLGDDGKPNGVKTRVKCGTQERHDDATAHPERWLGTVIEISHHGLGSTGKPRHPQFERRRDDRTSQEPKKAAPRPTRRPMSTTTGATGRMRNYGAMGDEKLLRCIEELEAGEGEAFERALTGSGNAAADLEAARSIAREKGLL